MKEFTAVNTVEPPVLGRLIGSSTAAPFQALKIIDEPCVGAGVTGILVNSELNHRKETKAEDGIFLTEKNIFFSFKISITDSLQLQLKL